LSLLLGGAFPLGNVTHSVSNLATLLAGDANADSKLRDTTPGYYQVPIASDGGSRNISLGSLTTVRNAKNPDGSKNSQKKQKLGSRMLQRLQPQDKPRFSDIDRYFDSARVDASDMDDQNWLCDWWRVHKKEYPRMAAAARDYLDPSI
jgi:hypothetical protein